MLKQIIDPSAGMQGLGRHPQSSRRSGNDMHASRPRGICSQRRRRQAVRDPDFVDQRRAQKLLGTAAEHSMRRQGDHLYRAVAAAGMGLGADHRAASADHVVDDNRRPARPLRLQTDRRRQPPCCASCRSGPSPRAFSAHVRAFRGTARRVFRLRDRVRRHTRASVMSPSRGARARAKSRKVEVFAWQRKAFWRAARSCAAAVTMRAASLDRLKHLRQITRGDGIARLRPDAPCGYSKDRARSPSPGAPPRSSARQ